MISRSWPDATRPQSHSDSQRSTPACSETEYFTLELISLLLNTISTLTGSRPNAAISLPDETIHANTLSECRRLTEDQTWGLLGGITAYLCHIATNRRVRTDEPGAAPEGRSHDLTNQQDAAPFVCGDVQSQDSGCDLGALHKVTHFWTARDDIRCLSHQMGRRSRPCDSRPTTNSVMRRDDLL